MKKHGTTILLILIFILGLGLLLYPTVSDWWNSQHQSKAIATYSENVSNLKEEEKVDLIDEARQFNKILTDRMGYQYLTDEELKLYESVLDITGTGIMAYIEIPSIDVSLPIYHTVSESVLQIAVGHIEWTSLPVGGESTHCVLSGHRGLPSAKLFTNLDKVAVGDIFMINTVGETFTYQVYEILIVEPEEISALAIEPGKDLCTLVTCTPYGVNSHRLLVRGQRIANIEEEAKIVVTPDANQIDPLVIAPVVAAPMLLVLLIYVMIKYRKKK
ncbi:MAG: class C sortase [Clostridia bacterium]|nr:class C sortase [Clostridia bacterium]